MCAVLCSIHNHKDVRWSRNKRKVRGDEANGEKEEDLKYNIITSSNQSQAPFQGTKHDS